MSKFAKPKASANVDAVIERAQTDGSAGDAEVRFTMTLPADIAGRVDRARRRMGVTRLAWIRMAIASKLDQEG